MTDSNQIFKGKMSDSFANVGMSFFCRCCQINSGKASSRDFYKLLNDKTHPDTQIGPKRWSKTLSLSKDPGGVGFLSH